MRFRSRRFSLLTKPRLQTTNHIRSHYFIVKRLIIIINIHYVLNHSSFFFYLIDPLCVRGRYYCTLFRTLSTSPSGSEGFSSNLRGKLRLILGLRLS